MWPLVTLTVGGAPDCRTGEAGFLDLALAAHEGRTVVARDYATAPLAFRVTAPPWPGPRMLTGAVHGRVLALGGGLLAGQSVYTSITVGQGARASIGTVGATVVHGAESGAVTHQSHRFHVGAGGLLVYLPDETIPCRGARLAQQTEVTLEGGASLLYGEVLTPGRLWHGERFAYHDLQLDLIVRDDRRPLLIDRATFCPAEGTLHAPGRLAGHTHLGTLAVFGPHAGPALSEALHDLARSYGLTGSASPLYAGGVLLRLLGDTAQEIKAVLRQAVVTSLDLMAAASAEQR